MPLTYQDAVDTARLTLNDAAKVRYPDATLFKYACDGVREVCFARPDLFTRIADFTCVAGAKQTVAPQGLYVLDVHGVKGGRAITKGDFDTLRRYRPRWQLEPAAEAENWFPGTTDQAKRPQPVYYVYPRAPSNQRLTVEYVADALLENPPDLGALLPLPDMLNPAIGNYVIFRAESVDDEHVVTQRAANAYSAFANIIGIAEKAKKLIVQEGRPQ